MPTQTEKLAAHAEHLLDGFLGLRERWAMLSPMLSNHEVKTAFGRGYSARGFNAIRTSLLFSCIVDIANLCTDKHDETPSLKKVHGVLLDAHLRTTLMRVYSQPANPISNSSEHDERIRRAVSTFAKQQVVASAADFDTRFAQFTGGWAALETSPTLGLFCDARDKVAAHSELHYVNGSYRAVSLASLGLKPEHFSEAIASMQPLVELAQNLTRSAGFAWTMLDAQLAKASAGFWAAK